MSHVLISDLLKPCLFFDCLLVIVTGHFKRLSVPCTDLDVIEITVQQGNAYIF